MEIADAYPTRCGRISPLDGSILRGSDLDLQAVKSLASRGASYRALVPVAWAYIAFSSESLVAIKRFAMENVCTPPGFVSTDDALAVEPNTPKLSYTTRAFGIIVLVVQGARKSVTWLRVPAQQWRWWCPLRYRLAALLFHCLCLSYGRSMRPFSNPASLR